MARPVDAAWPEDGTSAVGAAWPEDGAHTMSAAWPEDGARPVSAASSVANTVDELLQPGDRPLTQSEVDTCPTAYERFMGRPVTAHGEWYTVSSLPFDWSQNYIVNKSTSVDPALFTASKTITPAQRAAVERALESTNSCMVGGKKSIAIKDGVGGQQPVAIKDGVCPVHENCRIIITAGTLTHTNEIRMDVLPALRKLLPGVAAIYFSESTNIVQAGKGSEVDACYISKLTRTTDQRVLLYTPRNVEYSIPAYLSEISSKHFRVLCANFVPFLRSGYYQVSTSHPGIDYHFHKKLYTKPPLAPEQMACVSQLREVLESKEQDPCTDDDFAHLLALVQPHIHGEFLCVTTDSSREEIADAGSKRRVAVCIYNELVNFIIRHHLDVAAVERLFEKGSPAYAPLHYLDWMARLALVHDESSYTFSTSESSSTEGIYLVSK